MAKKKTAGKSKTPAPAAKKSSTPRKAGRPTAIKAAATKPSVKKSETKASAAKSGAKRPVKKTTHRSGTKKAKAPTAPPAEKKPAKKRVARRQESKVKPAQPRRQQAPLAASEIEQQTVDGYLATLNGWRKEAVAGLRRMIQRTAPQAAETVSGTQPVYEHHGPFAWIKAHARHVNLGFWRGVELPDPRKLLRGTGNKMRHIKLGSLKEAGKKELEDLIRVAAKLNEIKGSPTRPVRAKAKHK